MAVHKGDLGRKTRGDFLSELGEACCFQSWRVGHGRIIVVPVLAGCVGRYFAQTFRIFCEQTLEESKWDDQLTFAAN